MEQHKEKPSEEIPLRASERMEGGSHYLGKRFQVFDISFEYNLNPHEHSMLKYLLRRKEERVKDLKKLKHVCELEIERLENGL